MSRVVKPHNPQRTTIRLPHRRLFHQQVDSSTCRWNTPMTVYSCAEIRTQAWELGEVNKGAVQWQFCFTIWGWFKVNMTKNASVQWHIQIPITFAHILGKCVTYFPQIQWSIFIWKSVFNSARECVRVCTRAFVSHANVLKLISSETRWKHAKHFYFQVLSHQCNIDHLALQ